MYRNARKYIYFYLKNVICLSLLFIAHRTYILLDVLRTAYTRAIESTAYDLLDVSLLQL